MPVESYRVDVRDPRAPPQELWERLTPEERARIIDSLPSEFPVSEASPPEGDPHYEAVDERLRFFHGRAPLPEANELISTLESMVERMEARGAELEQQLAEESRLRQEEARRREDAERRLAEVLAELERLRGGRG